MKTVPYKNKHLRALGKFMAENDINDDTYDQAMELLTAAADEQIALGKNQDKKYKKMGYIDAAAYEIKTPEPLPNYYAAH